MPSKLFAIVICVVCFSCNYVDSANSTGKQHSFKIDRQRCSFQLAEGLNLGSVKSSSFDDESYFKIYSAKSSNIMQIFVYNTNIDAEEHLQKQIAALNKPDIFSAASITRISQMGTYQGVGALLKGIYKGGVVKGAIKIFCFGNGKNSFVAIRQIIDQDDVDNFDLIEKSFVLK